VSIQWTFRTHVVNIQWTLPYHRRYITSSTHADIAAASLEVYELFNELWLADEHKKVITLRL
jgi:hypothetical protein